MENALSHRRPGELSTPSNALALTTEDASHRDAIMVLLAKLGVRRQARLDPLDYSIFAEDLAKYDLADVEAGLERLKHREEYEPAFPDLGLMETNIDAVIRLRKAEARRAVEAAREAAEAQHRIDHTEEYVPVRDVWKDVMERVGNRMAMPDGPAPKQADAAAPVQPANTGCAPAEDAR